VSTILFGQAVVFAGVEQDLDRVVLVKPSTSYEVSDLERRIVGRRVSTSFARDR
jgi:hypothetical protein